MAYSSFDIVSKVDDMEVQNAMGQAQKEIQQRYDFKNVGASLEFSGEKILMKANAEERVKAVLEVFEQKLIKRGISLRSLDAGKPVTQRAHAGGVRGQALRRNLEEVAEPTRPDEVVNLAAAEGPRSCSPSPLAFRAVSADRREPVVVVRTLRAVGRRIRGQRATRLERKGQLAVVEAHVRMPQGMDAGVRTEPRRRATADL
jgi:hypothetical protein